MQSDGNEGAQLAESYHPDIVLSDVMMPDTSGIDLLKSLQADDPSRPVILMTGYSTVDMVAEAMKDGARDFLTKPLDYRKLKSILEATQRDLKSPNESKTLTPISAHGAMAIGDDDRDAHSVCQRSFGPELGRKWHSRGKVRSCQ